MKIIQVEIELKSSVTEIKNHQRVNSRYEQVEKESMNLKIGQLTLYSQKNFLKGKYNQGQ